MDSKHFTGMGRILPDPIELVGSQKLIAQQDPKISAEEQEREEAMETARRISLSMKEFKRK